MYDKSQLQPYLKYKSSLIPINQWNKLLKGKEAGKIPLNENWTSRLYPEDEYKNWIVKGYNLGFRLSERDLVIDIDPRNYDLEDSEKALANIMGFECLDDLIFELPCVRTGGGGWHIYLSLPDDVNSSELKETIKALPGIEFKRKGRQVLAAGSKHPSGSYYKWETKPDGTFPVVCENLLRLIRREKPKNKGKYTSGKGVLNGAQLKVMILDRLDPKNYSSYDEWFPLMAASHHATNGDGIDEFVAWSLGDPKYSEEENTIRNQWERLWDKENSITIGTLIQQLDNNGEDSSHVRAALDFQTNLENGDFADDDETEEAKVMLDAEIVASQIDLGDVVKDPDLAGSAEGKAIRAAKDLKPNSTEEDIMKCLRLIKIAGSIEAERAINEIVAKKIMSKSSINKLLRELESKMGEDLGTLLNKKTLQIVFNGGKYLLCGPNGILWMYSKTHWKRVSDEFLAKISRKTLTLLREKLNIEAQELNLINQSVKLCRIDTATITDRIHDTSRPVKALVNCRNGELWIDRDGTHKLRPHSYRSYQTSCLSVEYDPSSDCPLFKQTLHQIFANYPDTEELVRHMGELMGYMMQPVKNIASWWLFRGPGGDGKSTLIKILGGILGEGLLMTNVKLLKACTSYGNDHAFNNLVSRRCVVIEELPVRFKIQDEMVKMLGENTTMTANPKFKDEFSFIYCASLIMCSNGYPRVEDLSKGMFRRANVIPFNRQFDTNGIADLDRAENILSNPTEMSGVLNFMLEGLQRLRDRKKFAPPASCQDAKTNWLGEANNVYKFISENLELTSENEIACEYGTLYDITYGLWCQENGIEENMRMKKLQFRRELESLGFTVKRGGSNIIKVYGGKLKKKDDDIDELEDFDEI